MKKFLLFALMLLGGTCAGNRSAIVENWNGWLDTAMVADTIDSAEVKYTKAFSLTDGENLRVLFKVSDTTDAGFADDSVNLIFGYQTGSITLNSSGDRDTLWDDQMIIDTMLTDSFGVSTNGVVGADGSLTRYWGGVDTSDVSGYACMTRWMVPEWNELIRYVITGGANCSGDFLIIVIEQHRRQYRQVRNR